MAARARFEPATLRTKGDESTNEPPHTVRVKSHILPQSQVKREVFGEIPVTNYKIN